MTNNQLTLYELNKLHEAHLTRLAPIIAKILQAPTGTPVPENLKDEASFLIYSLHVLEKVIILHKRKVKK